jgi:hypothetical protein
MMSAKGLDLVERRIRLVLSSEVSKVLSTIFYVGQKSIKIKKLSQDFLVKEKDLLPELTQSQGYHAQLKNLIHSLSFG